MRNTTAEKRAIRLLRALKRAWRKSGCRGPHPGFDFRVYVGRLEADVFREAHAKGSVDDDQLLNALAKVWEPRPRQQRRRYVPVDHRGA